MILKIPLTHYEEVRLSSQQIRDVAIYAVRQAFEIPPDAFIEDRELKQRVEEYGGSHSWVTIKRVRDIRPFDCCAISVIQTLLEMK